MGGASHFVIGGGHLLVAIGMMLAQLADVAEVPHDAMCPTVGGLLVRI
jgi:hypothetical protein